MCDFLSFSGEVYGCLGLSHGKPHKELADDRYMRTIELHTKQPGNKSILRPGT